MLPVHSSPLETILSVYSLLIDFSVNDLQSGCVNEPPIVASTDSGCWSTAWMSVKCLLLSVGPPWIWGLFLVTFGCGESEKNSKSLSALWHQALSMFITHMFWMIYCPVHFLIFPLWFESLISLLQTFSVVLGHETSTMEWNMWHWKTLFELSCQLQNLMAWSLVQWYFSTCIPLVPNLADFHPEMSAWPMVANF